MNFPVSVGPKFWQIGRDFSLIWEGGIVTSVGASDSGGETGALCSYQLMKGRRKEGRKREWGMEKGRGRKEPETHQH